MTEQASQQKIPERRCLATGQSLPRGHLLRFVAGPDNQLVPDLAGKLPGRGLWITPERDTIEKALRKGLFSRAARRSLRHSEDLISQLESLSRRRLLDALGLARRAGEAAVGYVAVEGMLRRGRVALLLEASDGAEDGLRKLMTAARAGGVEPLVIRSFDAAELGLAVGRGPVVHLGLASGRIADRFRAEWDRLSSLCAGASGDAVALMEDGKGKSLKGDDNE